MNRNNFANSPRRPGEVTGTTAPHRIPLPGTGWELWRDAAVAGAGFPARQVTVICDDDLAAAADTLAAADGPGAQRHYDTTYLSAIQRLAEACRDLAAEPRFREAVAWQEPALLTGGLERARAGWSGDRQRRRHEPAMAWHLQRYCLSPETLGFFGPVGWARISQEDSGLSATPGRRLLTRRTAYLEWRAVDALAGTIAARPEVLPWLTPRPALSAVLDRDLLRLPFRPPVPLTAQDARVLQQCDGTRPVRAVTGDPADPAVTAALLRLRDVGAVRLGLYVPVSAWPERELARLIRTIRDQSVRDRALSDLARLGEARDQVSEAAGDAIRLHRAACSLAEAFGQITGQPGTHHDRHRQSLVYEDAVRDGEVRIGRQLTDRLAGPLGLLLDSAAWLTGAVAAEYRDRFLRVVRQTRSGNGTKTVPLLPAAARVMPELFRPSSGLEPAPVAGMVAEFQRRWHEILAVPAGVRHHHVTSAAIAGQVARQFAAGSAPWSGARVHSADIMIATPDASAAARDGCPLVLDTLRPAANVLENRVYCAQHPDPGRLLTAAETDHRGRRIYAVPSRDAAVVTSRLCPPSALLSSGYAYLCLGDEAVDPPAGADVLPGAGLVLRARGDDLTVRLGQDGPEYDFGEVIGELLAVLLAPAFRLLDAAAHQPRVSIDTMVVSRETWRFPAAATGWAFTRDEGRRYAAARRWQAAHGLPERMLASLPGEAASTAVDFRSLPLVSLLAQLIRRAAKTGWERFTLTEMLPDLDQLWLRDRDGDRYVAALRLVAVDARAR